MGNRAGCGLRLPFNSAPTTGQCCSPAMCTCTKLAPGALTALAVEFTRQDRSSLQPLPGILWENHGSGHSRAVFRRKLARRPHAHRRRLDRFQRAAPSFSRAMIRSSSVFLAGMGHRLFSRIVSISILQMQFWLDLESKSHGGWHCEP